MEQNDFLALTKLDYKLYCAYANNNHWRATKASSFLCDTVQKFIDKKTGHAFDILAFSFPPQHGKGFEEHTPVLTTKGWKEHGQLKKGDYVYSPNGKPVMVLNSQTPYEWHCMELKLDSGDTFICSYEHLWQIEANRDRKRDARGSRETETLEAQHIFDGYHAKSPAVKTAKIDGGCCSTPIDPYLLGVWLGDGYSLGTAITVGKEDLESMKKNLSDYPFTIRKSNSAYSLNIGCTDGKQGSNKFRNALKAFGLIGNKHIPEAYFNALEEDRLELLMGLLDTDGTVSKNGCIVEYCGTNETLVRDVFKLVRGLGIKCSFKTGKAMLNGKFISPKFRVQFTPNKGQKLFKLERKQLRVDNKTKKDRNDKNLYFIKSVKPVGNYMMNCITVEGGLYCVGYGMIPTHNSYTVTETLPSWYLITHPRGRVIEISYNEDFAQKFGRQNRRKLAEFGSGYGVKLCDSPNSNVEFEIESGGSMISRGIMSGITGRPCDLMIIDDPIKNREEADSEVHREKIWGEWLDSCRTRLSAGAKVIVIQTRWHEDDLIGRMIANEPNITYINLPCEAEENDPLGRELGDSLMPEIGKDRKWLEDFKKVYNTANGSRSWNALFQGHPSFTEGNILKASWWKRFDKAPEKFERTVISVDASFKEDTNSDYVAITVWGKTGTDIYLIDMVHKQMGFTDTTESIAYLLEKYPKYNALYIEEKANGSAIIDVLRRKFPKIVKIQPKGGKISRVESISGVIEGGNVWIPRTTWGDAFIEECSQFPRGKHDDMVDSMSQCILREYHREVHQKVEVKPQSRFLHFGFKKETDNLGRKVRYASF